MQRKRPTTINDIARLSGYSKTAVSFAFNFPTRISEQARLAILSAADQLGYIPDPRARNFSLRRSTTIGLLLPSEAEHPLSNPYLIQIIRGIYRSSTKRGYTLSLLSPTHSSAMEAVRNAVVDGIITIGAETEEIGDVLRARGLPVVTIDGTPSYCDHSFSSSLSEAAALQMRVALEHGHRSIVIASNAPSRRTAAMMLGYEEALKQYGLSSEKMTVVESRHTLLGGSDAAKKIVALLPQPTCIVAMSDIIALGILSAFTEHDIAVPDEISIIGFDGIDEGLVSSPALTTIGCGGIQKGEEAASALCSLIEGDEEQPGSALVDHQLLLRSSLANLAIG